MNTPIDITIDRDVPRHNSSQVKSVHTRYLVSVPERYKTISTTVKKTTSMQPSIELLNIPFYVRRGEDAVFIESLQWPSLRTFGETFEDAVSSMMELIQDVLDEFVFSHESELAPNAIEFRAYLIETIFS